MAEITELRDQTSPTELEEPHAIGNGSAPVENRGIKRPRPAPAADDDDDDDEKGGRERRKIEIKFISDKSRRHITFSKRKAGIMKKAYELSVLTGTQVLLLVVSETGLVYTFTTPKLQPLVTKAEGKNLIQACLNAPEPVPGNENGVDTGEPVESPDDAAGPHMAQANRPGMPPQPHLSGGYMPGMPLEAQQALAYQSYVQQRSQGYGAGIPPQPGMQPSNHHQG